MNVIDAVRKTGVAFRADSQGPEHMFFHMHKQWLFVCDGPLLDIAFRVNQFPQGDDWKACELTHPWLLGLVEQVERQWQQVGRVVDLITEDTPCLLMTPNKLCVVRYDGTKFVGQIPINNVLLFDAAWCRMSANTPLIVVGEILGRDDHPDSHDPAGQARGASVGNELAIKGTVHGTVSRQGEGLDTTGTGDTCPGTEGLEQATADDPPDGGSTVDR